MNNPVLLVFFVVLNFFSSIQLYSQTDSAQTNPVLDSLVRLIPNTTSDTAKIKIIATILQSYRDVDMPYYYKKGIEIAKNLEDEKWYWTMELAKPKHLALIGKNDESIAYYNQLLKKVRANDDRKIEGLVLLNISEIYNIIGDIEAAINTNQMARLICDSLGLKNQSARAHYQLSLLFRKSGKNELALEQLEIAKKLLDVEKNPSLLVSIYNNFGRINRGLAKYDTAHVYYTKALEIANKYKVEYIIPGLLNNLGNIAHTRGNLEDALKYYVQSLEIKEKKKDKKGICVAYHNIAAVRMDLKSFATAQRDFERSLKIAEEINYGTLRFHNYLKLGNSIREQNNIEGALEWHQKALDLSTQMDFKSGLCDVYYNIGIDYQKMQRFDESLVQLFEGLTVARAISKKATVGIILTEIANTYMLNAENPNPEFQRILASNKEINIEEMLLEGSKIAQEIGNLDNVETSLTALRKYYRQQNLYQKEAEISDLYIQYRDSLFNQQSAKAISQWETRYSTAEKEKEIVLLQKEKEIQEIKSKTNRNRFIGGGILLLLASGLFFTRQFYRDKVLRAKQVEKLRTKISSDLHDDVGSVLTGLAMQTEILQLTASEANKEKLGRVNELSRSAMSQMRDAVWAMDAQKDNWNSLIDRMNEFASEMLSTKEIGFSIKKNGLDGTQNLSGDLRHNIFLIFKEAITNIIKHSNASTVNISISKKANSFEMRIKDNGELKEKNYKTTGLGTQNMQMRAQRINGTLNTQFDNGFEVCLSI